MQRFGPSNATLTVRTFREGIGASAGHDASLVVTDWQATPNWNPPANAGSPWTPTPARWSCATLTVA